tara:strand:- start:130 stop:492 length:363 start_codon:yes stop_codon:yes gene_type:complete
MNRWVLLEHTITNSSFLEVHFDFLVENGSDCLTWKINEIPKLNGSFIKIIKQPNHRLGWLTTKSKMLSGERGYVKRIDYGKYSTVENNPSEENFSLKLQGNLLIGIFSKKEDFCKLYKYI